MSLTDEQLRKIEQACRSYGHGDNPFDAVEEVRALLEERGNLLADLAEECTNSVTVEINNHRDGVESVEDYLTGCDVRADEIAPEIRAEMIARDEVVLVQFYPDTSIGSYRVWHYDVQKALEAAVCVLDEHRSKPR